MKIALLGGTFNPVHTGHLLIAQLAIEKQSLDRVIFLPAGLPPHKTAPLTLARHRLAMLRLAVRGNPSFSVSDWEIRQRRVVYTHETVDYFRTLWPRASLFFIIGSDSQKTLPQWRRSAWLRRHCRFITIPRIPLFASTDIRRRVRKRLPIRYYVPDPVARYIQAHRLYRRQDS